jgi:acyl carrier protein
MYAKRKCKGEIAMVFEKIRELIVEQLDVDASQVTMDTDFMKDLEADSLDAVEIILGVEEEYGIEIPDEVAENFTKVSDIVKYVEENK